MAKCVVTQKYITKTVKIPTSEITLTLTPEEAECLHALTGMVVGGGAVYDKIFNIFDELDNNNVDSRFFFKDSIEINEHYVETDPFKED